MDEKDKEYNGRVGGEDEEDEDASHHLANSKDGLGDPLDDSKACHDKDSCIELTLKSFCPKTHQTVFTLRLIEVHEKSLSIHPLSGDLGGLF